MAEEKSAVDRLGEQLQQFGMLRPAMGVISECNAAALLKNELPKLLLDAGFEINDNAFSNVFEPFFIHILSGLDFSKAIDAVAQEKVIPRLAEKHTDDHQKISDILVALFTCMNEQLIKQISPIIEFVGDEEIHMLNPSMRNLIGNRTVVPNVGLLVQAVKGVKSSLAAYGKEASDQAVEAVLKQLVTAGIPAELEAKLKQQLATPTPDTAEGMYTFAIGANGLELVPRA